jgi:hypothetical protein
MRCRPLLIVSSVAVLAACSSPVNRPASNFETPAPVASDSAAAPKAAADKAAADKAAADKAAADKAAADTKASADAQAAKNVAAKAVADKAAADAKAARTAASVTLGVVWANNSRGYGTARPGEISAGGDSSGNVSDITWSSWGGAQATGHGTGIYWPSEISPSNPRRPEPVTIVAYDLGTCAGHAAYKAVTWYFPQEGQHLDLSKAAYGGDSGDICTPG